MSDAMTGAEGVIETDLPQSAPRERIQSDAHRARWKGQLGNGDMTLEHAGEAVADLFARVADGDRPRDVGGSVGKRSEERRVGKECGSTCRSRWTPSH